MVKKIVVPGDKSISHRAIMLGALAEGETRITGFLASADCLATIDCFRKMGIEIQMTNDKCQMSNDCTVIIKGKGLHGLQAPKEILNVGNSGTTIRLMSGILAGQPFSSEITGDASIQRRPMGRVAVPLRLMGAKIEGDYAPLKITGTKLKGINYELPVASAQVKSAIMLAGLFADGETTVVEQVKSRDHTERMFEYLKASNKGFRGMEIDVPRDLSSAAFFMVLGLIVPDSEIVIENVGLNPTRTGIIDVLVQMGGNIEISDKETICNEPRGTITVKTSKLKGIEIDGEIIPRIIDEIPIIAVAATQAKGRTEIHGAGELKVKESDRIAAVSSELTKMRGLVTALDDGLAIEGPTKLKGTEVMSYGDHRIAMSLMVASKIARGKTTIDDVACIETSFPGFTSLL